MAQSASIRFVTLCCRCSSYVGMIGNAQSVTLARGCRVVCNVMNQSMFLITREQRNVRNAFSN